ncbi:hypothetical protein Q5P01_017981 [Channa striata]|uniref:cAMP-dependent protein kinase inhibitor beta n=1 Tax=Channa striata TaxID=64152 RepID=A0AA88M3L2_CHASR|nr:hypothetical protein Q5P01_017981 [Channa striata]
MTEVEPVLDFASSGRSGRRNALPDILGSPAGVNPGDLPLKLAELSLKDGPGGAQSPTAEEPPAPPESSEETFSSHLWIITAGLLFATPLWFPSPSPPPSLPSPPFVRLPSSLSPWADITVPEEPCDGLAVKISESGAERPHLQQR